MDPPYRPLAPLPPRIRSLTPGTWAHSTMSHRLRTDILSRVYRENDLSPSALAGLRALDNELAAAATTPLSPLPADDGGADVGVWAAILAPHLAAGETWLSAPWVVAEFYAYRKLLGALGWFREVASGAPDARLDPFVRQKELGLLAAAPRIDALSAVVEAAAAGGAGGVAELGSDATAARLLQVSLWGNRSDLSLWPVGGDAGGGGGGNGDGDGGGGGGDDGRLLADDTPAVLHHLRRTRDTAAAAGTPPPPIHIVVDNAGFELFTDLVLADGLLAGGWASAVVLQCKSHPTFVSDAMAKDVAWAVAEVGRSAVPTTAAMGRRWADHLDARRLVLVEHDFWVQPSAFWEMDDGLRRSLGEASLVVVKGDANYRRLLGDRQWAFDTPFADVAAYFPCPVVALRTLKAELAVGIPAAAAAAAAAADPSWLVSGAFGVVHYCHPAEVLAARTAAAPAPSA
ncbi:hypothetical protein MMPV_000101 [Pyropia vietnamensis]